MIKRFVVLRRRTGMAKEEFHRHWETVHGPMIARIPGVLRYVQFHVRSDADVPAADAIDGIAEIWFESEEAQRAAWATPEYAAVVADEPNLFDMDTRCIHPVMELRTVVQKE